MSSMCRPSLKEKEGLLLSELHPKSLLLFLYKTQKHLKTPSITSKTKDPLLSPKRLASLPGSGCGCGHWCMLNLACRAVLPSSHVLRQPVPGCFPAGALTSSSQAADVLCGSWSLASVFSLGNLIAFPGPEISAGHP